MSVYTRPLFRFFFIAPAPTQIYTLSLHDALPISASAIVLGGGGGGTGCASKNDGSENPPPFGSGSPGISMSRPDRKSTRLNSSHANISYAVFCLKKKNRHKRANITP